MDIIHLLPDSVANQIAAGEVVQRPSSVVKELMENAIDAGASMVEVHILDAGRTSIQVVDDGKGMSITDARLAFERHATSKILQADDLFTLRTMGFRGEALPSIAAVAQVRLTTRAQDAEIGTELCIEGSRVVSQQPCACPVGSRFEVCNLFYNIPARRKFLKSNQTELSHITHEFERIALVNPSVSFILTHGGSPVSQLSAGTTLQRIVALYGNRMKEQLLSVEVETTLLTLTGFVGRPEAARKKGVSQYLFVNGRYMRHPYFHKAVMEAYTHLIPEGEQIPYFLYFQVDPAAIDVNISPTKTEIKFDNEAALWQIVVAAVRDTLGRFNAVPSIDFDTEGRLDDIPAFDRSQHSNVRPPELKINGDYNPFHSSPSPRHTPINWEELYSAAAAHRAPHNAPLLPDDEPGAEASLFRSPADGSTAPEGQMEVSTEHLQFRGQYILTPVQSGLMIIDQHRAHVRILYDRFLRQMQRQEASSQGLLFPELLTLSPTDATIFESIVPQVRAVGFDISPLGGSSYSVLGVPAALDGGNSVAVLQQMVAAAKEKASGVADEMQHRVALVMARSAAIVAGQALSQQEMDTLVGELLLCANPRLTPSGQAIITVMPQAQIERMFN